MVKLKNNNLKINKKNIVWTISMLGLLVFLIIFNKTLSYNKPEDRPVGIEYAKAEVINIVSEELEPDPDFPYINIGKQQLELKIFISRGKRSSMPQSKTRPDSPVPSLQGPCDRSLKSEVPCGSGLNWR